MKTDNLLYNYFNAFPESLFQLIGEKVQQGKKYKYISEEIKNTSYRLDGIIFPEDKKGKFYFIEYQFQRKNLYSRIFAEIFLYIDKKKVKNEWKAVVIYPNRSVDLGFDKPFLPLKSANLIEIIYLDELNHSKLNEYPLNLLKILITNEREIKNLLVNLGNEIKIKVKNETELEKIQDLTISFLMAKIKKITIEELTEMLKPIMKDIRKSKAAKQLIREGELEGKRKGKLEGKLESARIMHRKGISKSQILEFTGLKKEDLKDL